MLYSYMYGHYFMYLADGRFVETFVKRSTSLALVRHLEANQKNKTKSMGIIGCILSLCHLHQQTPT